MSANFPFPPYPAQQNVMSTVEEAIKAGSNAMVESPTGTGKTMALLFGCIPAARELKVPVVYMSRTHAQCQQVVDELKRSTLTPRMTVLASRKYLCLREDVRNDPYSTLKCKALCAPREEESTKDFCKYYCGDNGMDARAMKRLEGLFDVEELRSILSTQLGL